MTPAPPPSDVLGLVPRSARPGTMPDGAPRVRWVDSAAATVSALDGASWAATLVSLGPDRDQLALARRLADEPRAGLVVLTTDHSSMELALEAEALGAVGVLPEPLDGEALVTLLAPLLAERGGIELPDVPADEDEGRILAASPVMAAVFQTVARVAPTPATVLITGESGTGKELVARAIHAASSRRAGPFVAVNCAAIPEHLLEAELFGHERGAFTGAVARREGRFGRADGGTLFLDEIGDMSLPLQAKILRALESGEVERLGAEGSVRVDARIVAATHQPLERRVSEGGFREDLFFRLAVVRVDLPPLRDRQGDVRALALRFAARYAARYDRPVRHLSREALAALETHDWPGNVRELRNVLDRAVLLARGDTVRSTDLRLGEAAPRISPRGPGQEGYPPRLSLAEVEGRHIERVLRHTGGHMGEAAEILGIHRNTMTAKVRDHGIDVAALGGRG